jgi:6-phosphogluconolactonase
MSLDNVQIVDDPESLALAAAQLLVQSCREAIAARGRFTVALSGGSTPRRLYQHLAQAPLKNAVDWQHVEFFWGDERAVPPDHPESNYRMAREGMLQPLAIAAQQIHRMPAERTEIDLAAVDYQAEIARVFNVAADGPPPSLDLVLLGMGPDGHTASLFPHTAALHETSRWVVANYVPKFATHRMTMTAPMINNAAHVAFLVAGEDKGAVLAEVLTGPIDTDRLPSQMIQPTNGRLTWLVDRASAKLLPGKT